VIRARLIAVAALLATFFLVAAPASLASAHPIGASAVYLTIGTDRVGVELALPLDKVIQAAGEQLGDSQAAVLAHEQILRDLVLRSLRIEDTSGQPFGLAIDTVTAQEVNSTTALVVRLTATPGSGRITGDLRLTSSLLVDQLPGHRAFVFLVSDLQAGSVTEDGPQPLGSLEAGQEELNIHRDGASWWTGFGAMVGLGVKHIAEGTDHMLFLVTLLLVAPLFARGGRWAGRRPARSALLRTLGIVTAFTAGHTTSLALVSFGLVHLPEQPVEVLVAISILVAAVHALRPLASRGEIIVGGLFGLVHGTAFATAILDLGLDTPATVVAVLGFNTGVEAAQLAIVLLMLPVLMLLATRDWYHWFRRSAASFSAIASVCWVVAILIDGQTVLQPVFNLLGAEPLLTYGLFVSLAIGGWAATRPVKQPIHRNADAEPVNL
jgi:hypothetical protein